MFDFTNGEGFQSSQSEDKPPPLTVAKRLLDEFEYNADADMSATKMKPVKIEKE